MIASRNPVARLAVAALVAVTAVSTGAADPPAPRKDSGRAPVHVVIAATTDLHGGLEPHAVAGSPLATGGLDVLAGYLANLRAAEPGRVVLVDSGDLFQGTLASNQFEGEPVVKAYNALGYAASAVGNHEFDFGPVGPHSTPAAPGDDPLGALKNNVAAARFPFLAANLTDRATGKPPSWVKRSTLVRVGGARVGIIGVAAPDTALTTIGVNVRTLAFSDPVPAIVSESARLRKQGADAVIVVAHIGAICEGAGEAADLSGCSEQAAFNVVRALPPGTIDVFFGGHTHRPVSKQVGAVPVVQAPALGRGLAVVDLWVDPRRHRAVPERTRARPLVDVCATVAEGTTRCDPKAVGNPVTAEFAGRPVTPVPEMRAILAPYLARVEERRRASLGFTMTAPFTRDYSHGSTLGALIADALRVAVPEADIAVLNSGGLRADLRATQPTYSDLFEVLPFDNTVVVVRMTGAEVREMFRLSPGGEHGVLQESGLAVTLDPQRKEDPVVSITLADGTPLDPARTYTVAMNDFMAGGGASLKPLMPRIPAERRRTIDDPPMRELVIAALRKMGESGPLSPALDVHLHVIAPPSSPEP